MSGEAPSFVDPEYNFIGANFVLCNKETGETVFEMKRKTPASDDCYYLFKFYDENMPNEEMKMLVHEMFERMCPVAAMLDIGIFSFDEVTARCTEQVKKVYQGGGELTETQVDVEISLYDHARKVEGKLTIGLSDRPAS